MSCFSLENWLQNKSKKKWRKQAGADLCQAGCYNFFFFLSAQIWNSKFPVRMRYSQEKSLGIFNRITDWILSYNKQGFLFVLKLSFELSSDDSKLKKSSNILRERLFSWEYFLSKNNFLSYSLFEKGVFFNRKIPSYR